ncbi:MAG: ComF family protein [Lachnospiraceae bacterium]|nr:ComF family protein [Lachnospiraceae bacterium]
MIGERIIDIVFPVRCPLCGEVRPFGDAGVCIECEKELSYVKEPTCLKCGKTIESSLDEYCADCMRLPKSFEKCFPAFNYEGQIKDSLYEFKYKNQRGYAGFYCEGIMKRHGKELKTIPFDGIVPVPVHPHKKRIRGYNQAELIANQLSKAINVPVYPDYLVRSEDTNPQKELDDRERMKNLKNAFIISENVVKLNTVLLVDDIYTSGATMEACTEALFKAGVSKAYCTSVAIGRGY